MEKTLQAPRSIMHTSHHTHHHHPLQQVSLPCPHPHSSKFLQCQTKCFIHQLNISHVRSPELACILDLKPHNGGQFCSEIGNASIKGVPWHYLIYCIREASSQKLQAVEGHLPFIPCHIHSEPIIMTPTAISDEVMEGRMINSNFPLWVLRKCNDGLDVNKEIPDVCDL